MSLTVKVQKLSFSMNECLFATLLCKCRLHTFTSKGKSVQKLKLGIISFPVAPLRYLLKRIPPTRYTTSTEIKLQRKEFKNV